MVGGVTIGAACSASCCIGRCTVMLLCKVWLSLPSCAVPQHTCCSSCPRRCPPAARPACCYAAAGCADVSCMAAVPSTIAHLLHS